ncbi:hypothetical protein CSA56_06635 [candidate division KSB3 bacterium]|uniref:M23ase beta-sheet core domain-containing protein n=1 Tax=candidate division KSB3 bacterium TaxID=2044937 RepID=A0A2G6KGL8_9BACT|nr:MAG: hypothetical protein CSA56_06635 [candidate division KSB3 bacterium]
MTLITSRYHEYPLAFVRYTLIYLSVLTHEHSQGGKTVDCSSTARDDLSNQPPSVISQKFLCFFFICLIFAAGCSNSQIHTSPAAFVPKEEDIPQPEVVQTDATQLEFVTAYVNTLATILEFLKDLSETSSSQPTEKESYDFDSTACHHEEVIGLAACTLDEPVLIEDPFIEDNCIDSASSWCDPQYEKTYLAQLEEQRAQTFLADISPNFISPVENGLVLRGMQSPTKRRRGHYGVDIIPETWKRKGTPLRAVEDGTVVRVAQARGYGYYLVLYHQNGLFSLYSHTQKNREVTPGQTVQRGDTIAYMGKSGNARGYHLHFELIDLRDTWDLDDSIDTFVQRIVEGQSLPRCECGQFSQLLFAKNSKQDPLPSLPDLRYAKRVNGKWVAAGPVSPSMDLAQSQ